jgi:hypothetical protein
MMRTLIPACVAVAVAAAGAGCTGSARIPSVRYANQPPVAVVNDRRNIAKQPATRKHNIDLYHFDGSFVRLITRAMEVKRHQRALGVNAFDEVPDSTWFTNRIGMHDMTPDQIAAGPAAVGNPEDYKPWTIKSSKVGGKSVGFIVEDSRGKKFLLKFDRIDPMLGELPEIETANQIITGKLLWAAGYNVPEDYIVYLTRDDLKIADDAEIKDWHGTVGKLDQATVDSQLAQIVQGKDGRIRGLASLYVDGKPIGGHAGEGRRKDDPNDRIDHELRRDLRGAYALFEWLDHTDVKEDNTLDAYVEDPGNKDHHYIKHYLIDFGGSLGGATVFSKNPRLGYQYAVDFPAMFGNLITLGLGPKPWKHRKQPAIRGIGMYDAKYDPEHWKPETPSYIPFRTADRFDKFWAAKIMMKFTRADLEAVVKSAKFSDPRATKYMVDTLIKRQRLTARHWFLRVNPLDRFDIGTGGTLCFDDLLLTYKLAGKLGPTRYMVRVFDHNGNRVVADDQVIAADSAGTTCTAPIELSRSEDGYTVVRIQTSRVAKRGTIKGTTFVHLARDPRSHEARVIGIWRE